MCIVLQTQIKLGELFMPDKSILKAVESAEKDFREAEKKFDKEANDLKLKATHAPISLALTAEEELYNLQKQANYNAKIVEEFASVTADYKATCEAIILSLDTICRPLLKENLSAMVIGMVSRFISKVIKEVSNIKIDFSVSFNSSNLGDIGFFNPKPSVAVQTIERLWKEAYKGHPDYAKDAKRIKHEKAAEQKEEEEREKRMKDGVNKANANEKSIISNAASVTEKRELVINEGDKRISDLEQKLLLEASRVKTLMIDAEKERLQSELQNAEQELKATGFFDIANKKVLKAKISLCKKHLKNLATSPDIIQQLNEVDRIANDTLNQYKDAIKKHIRTRFKLVEKRRDYGEINAISERIYKRKIEVLNFLASKKMPQTQEDIARHCDYSSIMDLLQLENQRLIVRPDPYKLSWIISPDIKEIKIWEENSVEAKKGVPCPPTDIQEFFK